jgi:hypothetical protein
MKKKYCLFLTLLAGALIFTSCSQNPVNPSGSNNSFSNIALYRDTDSLIFSWQGEVKLEWSGGSPDSLIDSTSSVGYNFYAQGLTRVRVVFNSLIFNPYDTTGRIYCQLLNLDSISNPVVSIWKYGSQITTKFDQVFDLTYPRQGNFQLAAGIMRSPTTYGYPHRVVRLFNIQLYKVM